MGRRLVENVVLRNPDTGAPATFVAGEELPAWATKLVTNAALFGEDDQEDEPSYPEGEPSSSWKVPELKAYAAHNGVDLGEATRKGDILAVLVGDDGTSSDEPDPAED